jgi:hypothetical protein
MDLEGVVAFIKYCVGISLEGLRKPRKNQVSQYSNLACSEYEAEVIVDKSQCPSIVKEADTRQR